MFIIMANKITTTTKPCYKHLICTHYERSSISPVMNSEDSEALAKTALPTETFLNYNKLRARGIPDHAIKLNNSVDII